MKELDINIEGYNVNGICVGCLNYDRKMFYRNEVKEAFKIIGEIEVPDGLSIQVCWECLAAVQNLMKFRQRVLNSYDVLIKYSRDYPFLNSPHDLSQHATTKLGTHVNNHEVTYEEQVVEFTIKEEVVKEEDCDGINIDVKDESYDMRDTFDTQSSEDDTFLVELKKEGTDKKRKREKKKKKEKIKSPVLKNRLKNLPQEIVELYTMDEQEMWSVRSQDVASEEFAKVKHKCEDCVRIFATQKLMDYHIAGKHSPKDKTSIQCDVCKAYFINKENISVHRNQHFSAYKCQICGLVTTLKGVMSRHDCAKPSVGYVCSICNKDFSTKSKLVYHRSICNEERPQCDCCGKVFANKITLKSHLKAMSGSPTTKKPTKSMLIPCKGCDKVFYSGKSYRAHVVIHDGLNYPCPICGKLFLWKRNLARHTRNHREKESGTMHQCRDCGKTFSSRDCYNNHMKLSKKHVHESALSHACQYCNKRFAAKWCMVDHIDWEHLKRIKYRCQVCYKPFKTAKIMMAHMNNIHEGRNKMEPESEHLCEICGKSYKTVKRLKGHVWAMHTNRTDTKSFKCSFCPATFAWQTSIYKHMRMMHDNKRKQSRALPKKQDSYEVEIANRMQYFPQNINIGQIQPINIVQNI
ncbi:unnamed protein product [Pieris macdunnoughi]|uniref:C2H2-type domain-containing protein n=2 Tax=Pieris TaxID=7115 RepID=A0A821VRJ2_9NEOP|nr:unnamed protein product [Pieris macdunnoughi]